MLISLNWLKEFVDIRVKDDELFHRLTMAGFEVESHSKSGDDTIFEVNVTPNRGDCLSVIGLAREVAAIFNSKLNVAQVFRPASNNSRPKGLRYIKELLAVEVHNKTKCIRYSARGVEGVKIAPSPAWLANRLEACGVRPINNIVDATNYMMLETGQPFHAFDSRFINGQKIIIDTPKSDVDFVTLDGVTRKLTVNDLLICDSKGAIALAGVMGGSNSEVKVDTTTIVLESACFEPSTVRRTSKRLGLSSESSKRFERGVDPNGTVDNLNRLTELITKIADGTPSKNVIDIYPKKAKTVKVKLSPADVNCLIGVEVKQEHIKKFFKPLGISFSNNICTIPTFRPDLTRTVDLIEEVARLYGYDKIPTTLPKFQMSHIKRPLSFSVNERAREFLNSNGFYETLNYGFCSPKELEPFASIEPAKISNPLGIEFSAMKSSLISGLLQNLQLNINSGRENLRLFELRPTFHQEHGRISEKMNLSGIMYGKNSELSWALSQNQTDFYDIKGICEGLANFIGLTGLEFKRTNSKFLHPESSCKITCKGKDIGLCGLLHPTIKKDVFVFELFWDEWTGLSKSEERYFKPLDRFPIVRRDAALLLPENVASDDVLNLVKGFGSDIIRSVLPFDLYKGKGIPAGKKSMAFAIMYFHPERTLTDEEVNETHTKVVALLKNKLGAEIR